MILTTDIGNTNITLGVFDGEALTVTFRLATQRHRTADQYALELKALFELHGLPDRLDGAVVSSVVPELTKALCDAIRTVTGADPLVIGAGVKNGLKIVTDNPKELGADLVAGAVGAITKYPLPCLIMDLGTATKISLVDEGGVFRGCTIAPGIGISLDALAGRTSQLPTVALSAPTHVIGTNTPDAIRAGTVLGSAAMMDGMIDRFERELGRKVASVIATGGLSRDVAACCEREVVLDPDLVLEGLLAIYHKNQ